MRLFTTIYIFHTIFKKCKQATSPPIISPTKTCPTDPGTVNYIEFKDTQELISSAIQADGKTQTGVRPAVFEIDPCNGNPDFVMSHRQFISAWVRLEPGTLLSPMNPSSVSSTLNFVVEAGILNDKEFFGAAGRAAPTVDYTDRLSVPGKHQQWVFLIFHLEKILTSSNELTRLTLHRSHAIGETQIMSTDPAFDKSKSLIETCTTQLYDDRNLYNDATLTFKTDLCRFLAIREIWIPEFLFTQISNQQQFINFLAFGGKMKVEEKWSFQLLDRRHIEKKFGNSLTKPNLEEYLQWMTIGGLINVYVHDKPSYFKFKNLDLENKSHPSTTTVFKTRALKGNDNGFFSQKHYYEMINDDLGINEPLLDIDWELFSQDNGAPGWDNQAKATVFFYEYDGSSANRRELSFSLQKLNTLTNTNPVNEWHLTITIEMIPSSISENSSDPDEPTAVFYRVEVELSVTTVGFLPVSAYTVTSSVSKMVTIKTRFHKDNEFRMRSEMTVNSGTVGGPCLTYLVDILFLSEGGSHIEALGGVTGGTIPVKETNKGVINQFSDYEACFWKSTFGFECSHCVGNYADTWYDTEDFKCKDGNIPGLTALDGCDNVYNRTHCRTCKMWTHELDYFGGVCRKMEHKCPDMNGATILMRTVGVGYMWVENVCLSCPTNCKRCYYTDENGDFFYCREAYQDILDNGFNTTADTFFSPTCAVTNCAVCERERCDLCEDGFILSVDIVSNQKTFTCVVVSSDPNNRCPAGYLEARNSSSLLIRDFCYGDGNPPYGYYKKNIGYDYYEACDDSNDCTLCSVKSQVDSTGPLLSGSAGVCHQCQAGTSMYKNLMPIVDGDSDLCSVDTSMSGCLKKNLTNDCMECATGDPVISLVRTSAFTYGCSCSPGYYEDITHQTGCKTLPHNCDFAVVDPETNLAVCKICKGSHLRVAATNFCASSCVDQCSICNGVNCDECYHGYFLSTDKTQCSPTGCPVDNGEIRESPTSYICQVCVVDCKTCLSENTCSECKLSNYLSEDKTGCNAGCPGGEGKLLSSSINTCQACSTSSCNLCYEDHQVCTECASPKLLVNNATGSYCLDACHTGTYYSAPDEDCLPCPTADCLDCQTTPDHTTCASCQTSFFLADSSTCQSCGANCFDCNAQGCIECLEDYELSNLNQNICTLMCSADCLECQEGECLECPEGREVDPEDIKSCKEIENIILVDYFHSQLTDSVANYDYLLALHVRVKGIGFFNDQPKEEKQVFEITNIKTQETLTSITRYNKQKGLITYIKSGGKRIEKIEVRTSHPILSENPKHALKQKTVVLTLKNYEIIPEEEIKKAGKQATSVAQTGSIAESSSIGVLAVITLERGDPTGLFLKFNQFISLVHRLKFINIYYGDKLDPFLNKLGRWDDYKEFVYKEKIEGIQEDDEKAKRLLGFTEDYNEILKNQNSNKGKFNRFLEDFSFTLMVIIKESIYLLFWVAKIISKLAFRSMKASKQMSSEGTLRAIRVIRSFHFIVFNSSVMDFFFFGTRILLHTNTSQGLLIVGLKILIIGIFILKILDILEILDTTQRLKYTLLRAIKSTPKVNQVASKSPEKLRNMIEEAPISSEKKVIDFQKTFDYHERNSSIEEYAKGYIEPVGESYNSTFILHSNNFFILRLIICQVSVASLVHSPIMVLLILFSSELIFNLPTIVLSISSKGRVKIKHLIPKILQFLVIASLLVIFLLIQIGHLKKGGKVSKSLQDIGMKILMIGYSIEIVVLGIGLLASIYGFIVKCFRKRKKEEVVVLPKIGELDGEYFYKIEDAENDRRRILMPGSSDNIGIRRKRVKGKRKSGKNIKMKFSNKLLKDKVKGRRGTSKLGIGLRGEGSSPILKKSDSIEEFRIDPIKAKKRRSTMRYSHGSGGKNSLFKTGKKSKR